MSNVTELRPRRADWKRYGSPAAHLYPLVDVPDGIRVNGRLARLITAREDGCLISWQTGRKTAKDASGKPYEPMVEVPLESVREA